jgi:hypothetical protein
VDLVLPSAQTHMQESLLSIDWVLLLRAGGPIGRAQMHAKMVEHGGDWPEKNPTWMQPWIERLVARKQLQQQTALGDLHMLD